MIAAPISPWVVWGFEVKRVFFLWVMPALIGLLVAVLYPIGQKVARDHRPFLAVWGMAALGPAAMLFGWALTVRTIWTAPMYGLGYGFGVACLSRVHKLRLWPPKVITRRAAARRPW